MSDIHPLGRMGDIHHPFVPYCRMVVAHLSVELPSHIQHYLAATLSFLADKSPRRWASRTVSLGDLARALLNALHCYPVQDCSLEATQIVRRYRDANSEHWRQVALYCQLIPAWRPDIHQLFDVHFRKQVKMLLLGSYDTKSCLSLLPRFCIMTIIVKLAAIAGYLESHP